MYTLAKSHSSDLSDDCVELMESRFVCPVPVHVAQRTDADNVKYIRGPATARLGLLPICPAHGNSNHCSLPCCRNCLQRRLLASPQARLLNVKACGPRLILRCCWEWPDVDVGAA